MDLTTYKNRDCRKSISFATLGVEKQAQNKADFLNFCDVGRGIFKEN
jgi:hypothetical protein